MQIDGMLPPLVSITYPKEMSVFFDAHYLIECSLLTQNLTSEEMSNARFLLKFVLPTFLCINPSTIATQEQLESAFKLNEQDTYPISYATQLNINGFGEYIRKLYPEFVSLLNRPSVCLQ